MGEAAGGIGGEHATTVSGYGLNPGLSELMQIAEGIRLDKRKAKEIAERVRETVEEDLGKYLKKQ